MRMERGFFHMRLFLLCSNQGSEKFSEKPYDILENKAVSQKFCKYLDLQSASICTSLHTMAQKHNANAGQSRWCSTLTYSASSQLSQRISTRHLCQSRCTAKPCVSARTLPSHTPLSSTSRDTLHPIAYNKPQLNRGRTHQFLQVPCQHTNGLAAASLQDQCK